MLMAELQAIERAMKAHAAHTVTAQAVHAAQGFRQRPPPAPHDAMARARRASSQPPAAATAARRLDVPTPGWSGDIAEPAMLPIIRKALEGNRIDVYLQPVVTLPQRKVRFYEALTRLRSEDGTVIMPAQFMKVAGPAGLMSVVDNLLLFRCVQMLRRLSARQRDVAVFCNISGPTLHDREFFPQFLEFLSGNKDLANNIVFEFGQAAVMAANAAEAANLRHLANLGFRLSLDGVTQLNLDFARVRRLGFQFLKLKASTLLFGMAEAKADVAAEDFKALLFRNGIDLIVERIESEKTVVQLLDYDIEFGQGYLFGEPRPLRDLGEAGQSPLAAIPANVALLSRGLKRRLAG